MKKETYDHQHQFMAEHPAEYMELKQLQQRAGEQGITVDLNKSSINVHKTIMPDASFKTHHEIDYNICAPETLQELLGTIIDERRDMCYNLCWQLQKTYEKNETFESLRNAVALHCGERRVSLKALNRSGEILLEDYFDDQVIIRGDSTSPVKLYDYTLDGYNAILDDLFELLNRIVEGQDNPEPNAKEPLTDDDMGEPQNELVYAGDEEAPAGAGTADEPPRTQGELRDATPEEPQKPGVDELIALISESEEAMLNLELNGVQFNEIHILWEKIPSERIPAVMNLILEGLNIDKVTFTHKPTPPDEEAEEAAQKAAEPQAEQPQQNPAEPEQNAEEPEQRAEEPEQNA